MKIIKDAKIKFGLITDGSEQIMYESYAELIEHVPDAVAIDHEYEEFGIGYVMKQTYKDNYKSYIIVNKSDTFKTVKTAPLYTISDEGLELFRNGKISMGEIFNYKTEIMKKELTLSAEDMMAIHSASVKINSIMSKIGGLYNEKIHCPIKIEENHILSGKMFAIPFNNNKQSLYVFGGQYYVTRVCGELVDCTLTPCKREDLKAGDVVFRTDNEDPDFNELCLYCVILDDEEYAWISGRDVHVSDLEETYWYKVEKI